MQLYPLINLFSGFFKSTYQLIYKFKKLSKIKDNARNFLRENGNPFDILAEDKNGKNSVNFGVYGIPETILIDSELKILKKYIGPLNINDVNEIRKIVKK